MRAPSGLDTNDVFVPGQLPINPNNVYASRGESETGLQKTISRNQIPLVFGEYGVGKTSLVRHVTKQYSVSGKLVNIESAANKDLADIFKACLERIGYFNVKKVSLSTTHSQSGEAAGKASFGNAEVTAKVSDTKSSTGNVEMEYSVSSPTDSKFISLCEENEICLIIDELHNAAAELKSDLAVFIKAFANANCRSFKIILLGTSNNASELVDLDKGIDRKIQEFPLPSMNEEESRYVVSTGMRKLGMEIPESLQERLISLSVGSPDILQFLCLESAEAAIESRRENITVMNIDYAVNNLINNRSRRLYDKYTKVIEQVGEMRYRKQILRAMSESSNDYVTMEEIRDKVTSYLGKEVPSSALSGPLRDLKTAEFEEILQDVQKSAGGRVQNLTAFKDPSMKAFIRLVARKETFTD